MKAIVVDDEPLAAHLVMEYLRNHPSIEVVAQCSDGFEALKAVNEHRPDLLFLDVQMPKITGFEVLELLDHRPKVIFTTAFEEFALKAFDAMATDYLLKPFSRERFDQAIEKLSLDKLPVAAPAQHRIVLRDGGRITFIQFTELIYLQADDDYVHLKTTDKLHTRKIALSHYEHSLPADQFVRVHRSFMINSEKIIKIEPYEKASHRVQLIGGHWVPVSKAGYQTLRERLGLG